MNEDESLPILEEYDDGVVCFGPLTDSQLERNKKLPRCTIIPSNFKLRYEMCKATRFFNYNFFHSVNLCFI